MRRPLLCAEFRIDNAEPTSSSPSADLGTESTFDRVRRILSSPLSKRRPCSNLTPTFGVPLEVLINRDVTDGENPKIPHVVRRLCNFIETYGNQTEGLFRIGGTQKAVERLKIQYERYDDLDLVGSVDVPAAASLLKLFLRELPEPVIPVTVADQFIAVQEEFVRDHKECRRQLRELLILLPICNEDLLRYLCGFLSRIAEQESHNRMSPAALGIIFGPNLFRVSSGLEGIREQAITNQIVVRFIVDYNFIFGGQSARPPHDVDLKLRNTLETAKKESALKYENEKTTGPMSTVLDMDSPSERRWKRKETLECAKLKTDGKLMRSSSEERPIVSGDYDSFMRRVVSHEDVTRCGVERMRKCSTSSPLCEHNEDDDWTERMRSSERVCSYPLSGKTHWKKQTRRLPDAKENFYTSFVSSSGFNTSDEDSSVEELAYVPLISQNSRSGSPRLYSFLAQFDLAGHSEEPLSSMQARSRASYCSVDNDSDVILSPASMYSGVHLDPNIPPSPPLTQEDLPTYNEPSMTHLTRQLHSLKTKLRRYECQFENKFGFRPSNTDRYSDNKARKVLSRINKVRQEIKTLQEDSRFTQSCPKKQSGQLLCPSIEVTLEEIKSKLEDQRETEKRPFDLQVMSSEQLLDEKVALQKALLYFEGVHGRPTNREARELMRPLYERYRFVKRAVVKSGSPKIRDELAPILEHEAMDFTLASPQHRAQENETEELSKTSSQTSDVDYPENLHALSPEELLEEQKLAQDEKKKLRRQLRDYEEEFQHCYGRKVQKDDRYPMEEVYRRYKQVKGKLRLLEALLSKQEQ